MRWLMKILGKKNKKRAGFTLIELMVVVIVVGILAAAAVPVYRFAMGRARGSEGKALIGTLKSAEAVFYAETGGTLADGTTPLSDIAYIEGTLSSATDEDLGTYTDILTALGVDTVTNTWWHALKGTDTRPTTMTLGVTSTGIPSGFTKITSFAGAGPWIYATGLANTDIAGIELVLDLDTGKWQDAY